MLARERFSWRPWPARRGAHERWSGSGERLELRYAPNVAFEAPTERGNRARRSRRGSRGRPKRNACVACRSPGRIATISACGSTGARSRAYRFARTAAHGGARAQGRRIRGHARSLERSSAAATRRRALGARRRARCCVSWAASATTSRPSSPRRIGRPGSRRKARFSPSTRRASSAKAPSHAETLGEALAGWTPSRNAARRSARRLLAPAGPRSSARGRAQLASGAARRRTRSSSRPDRAPGATS